jgi:hypothetical protein
MRIECLAWVPETELLGTKSLFFDRFRFSFSIREPDRERAAATVYTIQEMLLSASGGWQFQRA